MDKLPVNMAGNRGFVQPVAPTEGYEFPSEYFLLFSLCGCFWSFHFCEKPSFAHYFVRSSNLSFAGCLYRQLQVKKNISTGSTAIIAGNHHPIISHPYPKKVNGSPTKNC